MIDNEEDSLHLLIPPLSDNFKINTIKNIATIEISSKKKIKPEKKNYLVKNYWNQKGWLGNSRYMSCSRHVNNFNPDKFVEKKSYERNFQNLYLSILYSNIMLINNVWFSVVS